MYICEASVIGRRCHRMRWDERIVWMEIEISGYCGGPLCNIQFVRVNEKMRTVLTFIYLFHIFGGKKQLFNLAIQNFKLHGRTHITQNYKVRREEIPVI